MENSDRVMSARNVSMFPSWNSCFISLMLFVILPGHSAAYPLAKDLLRNPSGSEYMMCTCNVRHPSTDHQEIRDRTHRSGILLLQVVASLSCNHNRSTHSNQVRSTGLCHRRCHKSSAPCGILRLPCCCGYVCGYQLRCTLHQHYALITSVAQLSANELRWSCRLLGRVFRSGEYWFWPGFAVK